MLPCVNRKLAQLAVELTGGCSSGRKSTAEEYYHIITPAVSIHFKMQLVLSEPPQKNRFKHFIS